MVVNLIHKIKTQGYTSKNIQKKGSLYFRNTTTAKVKSQQQKGLEAKLTFAG